MKLSRRDYAAELNAEQYAAVMTSARRALVIAGAGSGKTRTLTYRVARLLDSGVPPWRILLLTFTNKAAREMLTRVSELTGVDPRSIWGGTFHSVANRILRRHAERLGYAPGFTILDSDDQKSMFRALVKQYAGSLKKTDRFPKPELLLSITSLAANKACTCEEIMRLQYPDTLRHEDTILKIFDAYATRKKESNAMDFDDLLLNLARLLRENADLREEYSHRFLHVLVDEYQDTNAPQDDLISLFSEGAENSLLVVGDDSQSIYSWRGADVNHIFDFTRRYPEAELFKIETNYRSVPAILDISNAAIAQNERRIDKNLRAARPANGPLPAVFPAPDNRTEAQFVARQIDQLMDSGVAGKDIAVLYRAHFHSMDVQMELSRNHIPFRITSGLRFFEQAHVKDVVAVLRIYTNPRDDVAFRRIVTTFPKVGEVTANKLWLAWCSVVDSYLPTVKEGTTCKLPPAAAFSRVSVPAGARPSWAAFLSFLDTLHDQDAELTPPELINRVLRYLDPYLRSAYENFEERLEDISQMARTVTDAEGLDEFLSQVSLLSETDTERGVEQDEDCVTLSTIHQAKGLEWKVVFLIFLAEGMFPHYRALDSRDEQGLEEERRLFYVALTRAEDTLYLSWPRYNGRSYDSQFCPPSQFLTTLPEGLYELTDG